MTLMLCRGILSRLRIHGGHIMPGIPIKPAVLTELQRQLNQEYAASHNYAALSHWCEDRNFKGFARYFQTQSNEERVHARKFVAHLLDRGVLPELTAIPAPQGHFKSLMDVAKKAQAMEQANTTGINAVYKAAVKEEDYPAQVLLQWFISEQTEEEDWADEMVDRVEAASCAGGLSDLDRHIERYLTEEVVEEEGASD
jgi:ferritin